MIYMEYAYAYPDKHGIAAFGKCNVSMQKHYRRYDIRPDMANIVGVEPAQIIILDRKIIDTGLIQMKLDTYRVTSELVDCIAQLLSNYSAGEKYNLVGEWLGEMRNMLGISEKDEHFV